MEGTVVVVAQVGKEVAMAVRVVKAPQLQPIQTKLQHRQHLCSSRFPNRPSP